MFLQGILFERVDFIILVVKPQKAVLGRGRGWGAGDFPGSPVVRASPSSAGDMDLVAGQGAKIPHASWPKNQDITKEKEKIRSSIVANLKIGPH